MKGNLCGAPHVDSFGYHTTNGHPEDNVWILKNLFLRGRQEARRSRTGGGDR